MVGSYVLFVKVPEKQIITIGRLKAVHFPGGYYAYVGSAMGGFKARLNRHLKGDKKLHWHIDYLLQKAAITSIILCQSEDRLECTIAQALSRQFDSIPSFGCSDCQCHSHLFFATDEKPIMSGVMSNINRLGIKPRLVQDLNREAVAAAYVEA
ncbi:MAG: GIY-YIG nuclease family protein [Chloroflexi bacterium]|nr:GIY-YIG nuclease family protein [Chloroflexota bacterium]